MYLEKGEEEMLRGEMGPAVAKAMELLVAIGETFDAERLIPVEGAHISGVSYKNLGDAGLEFLEDLAEMGAKAHVRATLNPAGMDLELWREMGIPQGFAERQMRVIRAFERMGVEPTCTCTPYLVGHTPRMGSQVAWAESSAVAFSNSLLGARTNRESGPSALASSIAGRAPLYGYRLDEGRRPEGVVEVRAELRSRLDYSALGYHIGRTLGSKVPYIKGLFGADVDSLKSLAAACATSGGVALFHVEGLTPEAEGFKGEGLRGLERLVVEDEDLEEAVASLSGEVEDPVYCLGCPHCSLDEMWEAARLLRGRRLRRRMWIFTSRGVYGEAERMGYIDAINEAGGRVFKDTCMVVAPLREMGWRSIVTDSCKAAHYASGMGLEARLEPLERMVEEASS